jgi:hypothetical protein
MDIGGGGSSSGSYSPYNDYNILDNRITRNLQELISERGGEQKAYDNVFKKIREKLFVISEGDDIDLTETDKLAFTKKYNLTQSQTTINDLKQKIAELYLKKTEHEIVVEERRKLFETFCVNISNSLQSIDGITQGELTAQDQQLRDVLEERIDWYYSKLELDKLIDQEYHLKSEFHFVKKTLQELSAIHPSVLCSICMENQIDWFIDPCGHTLCETCKTRTQNKLLCHYCRTPRIKFNRLYL